MKQTIRLMKRVILRLFRPSQVASDPYPRRYRVGRKADLYFNFHLGSAEDKTFSQEGKVLSSSFIYDRFVKDGDVVVDVGANSGFHTAYLARLVNQDGNKKSQGRVYALEPVPWVYRRLVANVYLNRLDHVILVNKGAGSQVCEKKMFLVREARPEQALHSFVKYEKLSSLPEADVKEVLLPIVSLDSLLLYEKKVNFIKIDVQGYELEVLKGAMAVLEKHKPVLLFEYVQSRLDYLHLDHHQFEKLLSRYFCYEIYPPSGDFTSFSLTPFLFDRTFTGGTMLCIPDCIDQTANVLSLMSNKVDGES